MAQITHDERLGKIRRLLADAQKMPPKEHEVVRLPDTRGEAVLAHVINMNVGDVLLNPHSHRVRAQLEDDPEWSSLRDDPFSERAQNVIQRHVIDARDPDEFVALKESLVREGQTDPGVMTEKGVLVNANTRAAALRELEDPSLQYIRVAVLPDTFDNAEISLLELRLQMQRELKVDYTLTNELIFIEELANERHFPLTQIAREMRIYPENERKAANEVERRLKMLDLIRLMQQIPSEPIKLTFFDGLKLEQMRGLLSAYESAMGRSESEAQELLRNFLLSAAAGVISVHQIRQIDAPFMRDYMVPQLEDDEGVGPWVDDLLAPRTSGTPTGIDLLSPTSDDSTRTLDPTRLIEILTSRDKRVEVPGSSIVLDRADVADAVNAAITSGIADKRRDERSENRLEAPRDALRKATKEITACAEAVRQVRNDPEFDSKKRKALETNFNKLARAVRDLQSELQNADVLDT